MKADQIGATRGRLKMRELNRKRWVRNKTMDAKMVIFSQQYCSFANEPKISILGTDQKISQI